MNRFAFAAKKVSPRSVAAGCFTLVAGALLLTGSSALARPVDFRKAPVFIRVSDSVPQDSLRKVEAKITIDAPPVYVWHTLTNYAKLKNVLPGYQQSDVVSEQKTQKILDVAMSVSRLLPVYHYRMRASENRRTYQLKLDRISGDFDKLSVSYQLYPKSNGSQTILVYHLAIDPGNGTPTFGMGTVLKSNTEKTLVAVQKHSEMEHRKSLIGQR